MSEPASEPMSRSEPTSEQKRWAWLAWKRGSDIVVALMGLAVAAPVLLLLAALVRLDSPGPALFRQVRIGRGGEPFVLYKFRGMVLDARERFPELYDHSSHVDLGFQFHLHDDPRITRVGRVLRRTSLDELPNLWNVLRGDMSLVGPRPEIPEVFSLYGPVAKRYVSVKPGMTCYSGAGRRDEQTKQERVAEDLRYVGVTNPLTDLRLLLLTGVNVLRRRNVRA